MLIFRNSSELKENKVPRCPWHMWELRTGRSHSGEAIGFCQKGQESPSPQKVLTPRMFSPKAECPIPFLRCRFAQPPGWSIQSWQRIWKRRGAAVVNVAFRTNAGCGALLDVRDVFHEMILATTRSSAPTQVAQPTCCFELAGSNAGIAFKVRCQCHCLAGRHGWQQREAAELDV